MACIVGIPNGADAPAPKKESTIPTRSCRLSEQVAASNRR